jgi:hypothetical protein
MWKGCNNTRRVSGVGESFYEIHIVELLQVPLPAIHLQPTELHSKCMAFRSCMHATLSMRILDTQLLKRAKTVA